MRSTATITLSLALAASAQAYVVTEEAGLQCRSDADTYSAVQRVYEQGEEIDITCQTDDLWAKTVDGCYTEADAALYDAEQCSDIEDSDSDGWFFDLLRRDDGDLSAMADDYPYPGSCGGVDPWNYYKCQCTSFVAYRVNKRHGINFHNQYKGYHWSNANTWDEAARATGVKINGNAKVGTIAQSNGGNYGHVAWVSAVSGSQVTVEEYNWATSEGYGRRTVAESTFNYIHIAG